MENEAGLTEVLKWGGSTGTIMVLLSVITSLSFFKINVKRVCSFHSYIPHVFQENKMHGEY